jgi:hypothetical protein
MTPGRGSYWPRCRWRELHHLQCAASFFPDVDAVLVTETLGGLMVVGLVGLGVLQARGRQRSPQPVGPAGPQHLAHAAAFRYILWITRPPTRRYFKAGLVNFLSWRSFRRYTVLIPVAWWTDIFAQTFILKRSRERCLMHMAVFRGVVLSCGITFPLTSGWIRFTLVPPDQYQLWFVGFPVLVFPIEVGRRLRLVPRA